MKIKDNSGGILLFTVIASLVMSFVASSLVMINFNQNIIIEKEIQRKKALNLARAGFEYAYSNLLEGKEVPGSIEINGCTVTINKETPKMGDPDFGIKGYRITTTVNY